MSPSKKSIFMETTKIAPERTVAEIQKILSNYGANAVLTEYKDREVSAVSFKINIEGRDVPFRLPCRDEAISDFLFKRKKNMTHTDRVIDNIKEQAKRVAWRQILRWVEAQMAMVETDMVKIHEVFLPYMQTPNGETLFEAIESRGLKLLGYEK